MSGGYEPASAAIAVLPNATPVGGDISNMASGSGFLDASGNQYTATNALGSNSGEPLQIKRLWVGTAGDVSVTFRKGTIVTYKNVPAGTYLGPFWIIQVNTAGTTASNFVGEF